MIDEDGEPLGEMTRAGRKAMPEHRLFFAVILQALRDTEIRSVREAYLRDDAIRWLTGDCKDFRAVCELAGVAPEWVAESYRRVGRVRDMRGLKPTSRGKT